jgi:hypothetical protein
MIEKIISGGQTGADRAALDVAIDCGIPHGGWIPKGREAEDGVIPSKYQMQEMPAAGYSTCIEQNITDSDGTLIVSHGEITGDSSLTIKLAIKNKRPYLHINLRKISPFRASGRIINWLYSNAIEVLNVAGPRASKDPDIYQATMELLKATLFVGVIGDEMPNQENVLHFQPQTVEEAVKFLIFGLSLKDKMRIANMVELKISTLDNLRLYIVEKFGLSAGNESLMESCRFFSKKYGIHYDIHEDDASAIIIRELRHALKKAHALRVVK